MLWFISAVPFTVPSAFMNITCMAPRSSPPPSSPLAPATMSGISSPSRSPIPATDTPKKSSFDSEGPFVVVSFISTVFFTVPFAFMNITCTAPRSDPPALSK